MGCIQSSDFEEKYNNALEETSLRPMFGKLKLGEKTGKAFYKIFLSVDNDKSGSIDIHEFFTRFSVDVTRFSRRVFECVDTSGDGDLDFGEFFVGVYNYCSYDKKQIARFAFNLFDVDGSGEIERQEVQMLVKMMFGKGKTDDETDKILRILDKDKDGKLSLSEFLEIQTKIDTMLKPAVQMQHQMQSRIMGASWWDTQIKHRQQVLGPTADISSMYASILATRTHESSTKAARKAKASKEAGHGKGETLVATRVYSKHDRSSSVVTKLAKLTTVNIREEWGKAEKWFRIGTDRWLEGKYIRVTSGDGLWVGGSHYDASAKLAKKATNDNVKLKLSNSAMAKNSPASNGLKGKSKYAVNESHGHWKAMTDKKSGKTYWHNKDTGKTTWTNPHA